jgi:ankyrin repeat protein
MKGDLMRDPTSKLPARPSLEQLRKQAKDLLHAARAGDGMAAARLRRGGLRRRDSDRSAAVLADAQLVVAREYGFANWADLVHHVHRVSGDASTARPLIRPVELRGTHPHPLRDGTVVTTDDVFRMFVAARDGELGEARALLARAPALAVVEYNYTPPIHFAVREGHLAIAEMLIDRGADLAAYRTYPFGDSLLMMAEEREHWDVAALLRQRLSRRFTLGPPGTQELIDAARAGDLARVEAILRRDATLARTSNETGDTALHHAAQHGHLRIVQALLDAAADPDVVRGDGYRPIHLALMRNWIVGAPREDRAAIVEALLARAARYTMLIAALRGDHEFIRTSLARDRALANEEDTCHHRPLSGAVRRGDIDLVRLLLEHGADAGATATDGRTPADLAPAGTWPEEPS